MEKEICLKCGTKMTGKHSEILNEITAYECPNCEMQMHLFEKTLDEYKKYVNKNIKEKLEKYLKKIEGISKVRNEKVEEFHWKLCTDYINRGGKYIRPTFLILTAEAMGSNRDFCLNTAAAMEISENWLLIHDDFEDQSTSRRGGPTLHLRYTPELAVNAGDALHIVMWKILQENIKVIGQEKTYQIMDEFYKMLSRTALGQTAELFYIHLNKFDLTYDEIYYIIDGKTSYYTIVGLMRLGAIIAENG